MKHLKIRAEYRPATKDVEVTLLEQSHFGTDFGRIEDAFKIDPKNNCVFKHNGVAIYSHITYNRTPIYFHKNKYSNEVNKITTWICLGDSSSIFKQTKVENTVPIAEWPALKAAIEAYNEWGVIQ